jgi:cell division protease FtsH
VAAEIDAEIRSFVEDGYDKAEEILSTHMDQLHRVAQYLIKYEKVDGPDFEKLMNGEVLPIEQEESGSDVTADFDTDKKDTSIDLPIAENDGDIFSGEAE